MTTCSPTLDALYRAAVLSGDDTAQLAMCDEFDEMPIYDRTLQDWKLALWADDTAERHREFAGWLRAQSTWPVGCHEKWAEMIEREVMFETAIDEDGNTLRHPTCRQAGAGHYLNPRGQHIACVECWIPNNHTIELLRRDLEPLLRRGERCGRCWPETGIRALCKFCSGSGYTGALGQRDEEFAGGTFWEGWRNPITWRYGLPHTVTARLVEVCDWNVKANGVEHYPTPWAVSLLREWPGVVGVGLSDREAWSTGEGGASWWSESEHDDQDEDSQIPEVLFNLLTDYGTGDSTAKNYRSADAARTALAKATVEWVRRGSVG